MGGSDRRRYHIVGAEIDGSADNRSVDLTQCMHDGEESLPSRVVSVVFPTESFCGVEEVGCGRDDSGSAAVEGSRQRVDAVPNTRRSRRDRIR